jgi:hypothetical protein
VHAERLHRRALHVDVPQLERQVVAAQNVPPGAVELDVTDGRDDLTEKVARRLRLLRVSNPRFPCAPQESMTLGVEVGGLGVEFRLSRSLGVM